MSLLDGFYQGSKYSDTRTNKQKMENRIQNAAVELVLDRDESFLQAARRRDTSIIVNNRDGGIQTFYNDTGRRYISVPSGWEESLSTFDEDTADRRLADYLSLALINSNPPAENEVYKYFDFMKNEYKKLTGLDSRVEENIFEFRPKGNEDKEKEDIEEGEGDNKAGELSENGISDNSSEAGGGDCEIKVSRDRRNTVFSFQDTELSPGETLPDEVTESYFYDNKNRYQLSKKREGKLRAMASQITKSFKGRVSKEMQIKPTKKFSMKALLKDGNDKIYISKNGLNGKHLNINLIIDMSGSMGGTPVENARDMVYLFNEVAKLGYISGSVLYSESGHKAKFDFPVPRDFVKNMTSTGGGEGLGNNLESEHELLKSADVNICMTDGQLSDDPILKSLYKKENIDIVGVYVNKDAEDLTEYTGSLNRWFSRSLVRHTMEELVEKLIHLGLRRKK